MKTLLSLGSTYPLAELGHRPLFGNQWLALLAVLAGVALVLIVVAAVGRWLAATHPSDAPPPGTAPAEASGAPTPEVLAVIAAAVEVSVGQNARIGEIHPVKPAVPGVEALMQQWSVEGRRQI